MWSYNISWLEVQVASSTRCCTRLEDPSFFFSCFSWWSRIDPSTPTYGMLNFEYYCSIAYDFGTLLSNATFVDQTYMDKLYWIKMINSLNNWLYGRRSFWESLREEWSEENPKWSQSRSISPNSSWDPFCQFYSLYILLLLLLGKRSATSHFSVRAQFYFVLNTALYSWLHLV